MATLEVQREEIQRDILSQAGTARAAVRAEASKALTRTPKSVGVGAEVGVNTRDRLVRNVNAWQESELSKVAAAETAALADLDVQFTKAVRESTPVLDISGLEPEEAALLKSGYGVDELNRRRTLAAGYKYEKELGEARAESTKDLVQVAGDQYISKIDYEALSAEDKKLINKIGVSSFNQVIQNRADLAQRVITEEAEAATAQFKAANFEIAPDVWLPNDTQNLWKSLTASQKKEVIETGSYTPTPPTAQEQFNSAKASGQIPSNADFAGESSDGGFKYTTPAPILSAQEQFNQAITEGTIPSNAEFGASTSEGGFSYTVPPTQAEIDASRRDYVIAIGGNPGWTYYNMLPAANLTKAQRQKAEAVTPSYDADNPYPEGTKEWYIFALGVSQDMDLAEFLEKTGGSYKVYKSLPSEAQTTYANMLSTNFNVLNMSKFGLDIIKAAKAAEVVKPEQFYNVTTSTGVKQVSVSEWDKKDTFDQLTFILGRAPTAGEMESVARPEMPVNSWSEEIAKIPVVGGFLGNLWSNFALGLDLIIPGTQSEQEQYYKETRGVAGDLLRQYKERMYADQPSYEQTSRLLVEALGFPAFVRPTSETVALKDITAGEWIQTGVNTALLATPKIAPLVVRSVKAIEVIPASFRARLATWPFSERPGLAYAEPAVMEPVIWMPETAPVFREFVTPESPFIRTNFGPSIEPSLTSYPGVGQLSYMPDYFKPSFYIKPSQALKVTSPSYARMMPTKAPIYVTDIPSIMPKMGLSTGPNIAPGVGQSEEYQVVTYPAPRTLETGTTVSAPKIGRQIIASPRVGTDFITGSSPVVAVPKIGISPLAVPKIGTGIFAVPKIGISTAAVARVNPLTAVQINTKLGLGTGVLTSSLLKYQLSPYTGVETQAGLKTKTKTKTDTRTKPEIETLRDLMTGLETGKGTKERGRKPFFYLPPAGGDEEEIEKKKKKKKKKLVPVPGSFGSLSLMMPTVLESVDRPFTPRPIIKKTRGTIRRAGKYPVAGFKEVRE
jgi:hypothetical protein